MPDKRKRDESPLVRQDSTKQPASSVLKNTEVSFPRGGSSALTPLELKQVANEAANEVLFGVEGEREVGTSKPAKKKKKTSKKSSASTDVATSGDGDEKMNVVEHINFKTLRPNSFLLGQISAINKHDITVSFTDGISGFVTMTHISEQFTSLLEELDDEMDEESDEDSDQEEEPGHVGGITKSKELPQLKHYFSLGQWLKCRVVINSALDPQRKKKQKKRIELSAEPQEVNDFSEEDLDKHCTIQCSVRSMEDHGAILDLGIEGITGFLPKKDIPQDLQCLPGSVFLASVAKKSGRTVTVNFDFASKANKVTQISSVDAVMPGQVIDFLCQKVTTHGIFGKAFGMVGGYLGVNQLRAFDEKELKHQYAIGSNVKCRIIGSLVSKSAEKSLILSTLPSVMSLENSLSKDEALNAFPIGYTCESCTILGRDHEYLYVALDEDRLGQVHFSKVGDVDTSNSKVDARVLGYNCVDRLYQLCTDSSMLKMKYLRAEDIPVGELVTGCEVMSVSAEGVNLALFGGQFKAFVPPQHISDVRLVYPERKFKIGSKVKGRILNVDSRSRIFVTLKKSLVGLEEEKAKFITSFQSAQEIKRSNELAVATVQRFLPKGCIISFFGGVRGFLPNAEISEVFVRKPQDHLRLGQTVIVKILETDEDRKRIIATCKISNDQAAQQKEFIDKMVPGRTMVDVIVAEKTKDSLVVELKNLNLRGVVYVGHLSDSRIEQNRASLKKIKIGSEMKGLVIDKDVRTHVFNLSLKQSLISDAMDESLPLTYEEVKAKDAKTPMHGYIKSISDKGLFVAFNGKFVGLVLPSYAVESRDVDINKTFYVNQSVTTFLLRTDDDHQRFLLTLKEPKSSSELENTTADIEAINPVDHSIKALSDFKLGKIVKGKIKAVKRNQLNVILADNLFGRVDVAEVFDTIDEIKEPMQPLANFKKGDIINVRIIGNHDIKSHKFLPITHQVAKGTVVELSIKPSKLHGEDFRATDVEDVSEGNELLGFVNNYSGSVLWLTISPCLKAKISALELADNGADLSEGIENRFPLGAALRVRVTSVDKEHAFITVTGRSHLIKNIKDAKPGMKVPARIVRLNQKYLLLDLGNGIKGISFATDALNDFSVPVLEAYKGMQNQVLPATVVSVDEENSRIKLSLRSSDAKTPVFNSHKALKQGDIVQALVKGVTDKGVFVYLSSNLEAFVPVSKLSDSFIKEWKKFYKPMQHVVGKIVKSEDDSRILLTLRESEINGELNILKNYEDIKVGDILTGHVKNVTDFGVFVKLDNTTNITGLAHRTEVADVIPEDLSLLFGIGDRVKAYVLKINPGKKQVSLSLKASHFSNSGKETEMNADQNDFSDEDEVMQDVDYNHSESEVESEDEDEETVSKKTTVSSDGLSLSADFDWTASILDQTQEDEESESDQEDFTQVKKSRRQRNKDKIVEDKTIEVNTRAPESIGDFERLIIGNPNSSVIWMNYMAFQLQLSEVDKAREIAERALRTINFREEAEKLNIWVAMLNLENTFGTDESLDEVFKRACQYMDSFTMHNKLLSIFQMSEKYDHATELFKVTAKKFGAEKVSIWVSWGDFLISRKENQEARSILSRALKVLPKRDHIDVVRKFAQLEYSKGEPESGRSLFEGLVADVPKRIDLWNVYLDQEIKVGEKNKVEDLFNRVIIRKLTRKQAKFFFNKWLQFEEAQNDSKAEEYVKAKASEYAEKHPKPTED